MSFDHLSSLESQRLFASREDERYYDDPEFSTLTGVLSDQLFSLTSEISQLESQITLLGTRRDNERVRERVHNLLEQVRNDFQKAGSDIKKVQLWDDATPSQKWTQQKISREFQSVIERFQAVQRRTLEKQRASAKAAKTAIEEDGSNKTALQDGQNLQQLHEQQSRLAPQDEVDFQESLIIERESEIRNIEQSVGELNELFRDVAHIVQEQGGQLELVSDNVQRATHDTRGADTNLLSANRYQKNARTKGCFLLFVLLIILTIVILAAVLA